MEGGRAFPPIGVDLTQRAVAQHDSPDLLGDVPHPTGFRSRDPERHRERRRGPKDDLGRAEPRFRDRASRRERPEAMLQTIACVLVRRQDDDLGERGPDVAVDILFAHPRNKPSASLHEPLGLATIDTPLGIVVEVDDRRETSIPGIYAAGDLANPLMPSVTTASWQGAMAAISVQQSMLV